MMKRLAASVLTLGLMTVVAAPAQAAPEPAPNPMAGESAPAPVTPLEIPRRWQPQASAADGPSGAAGDPSEIAAAAPDAAPAAVIAAGPPTIEVRTAPPLPSRSVIVVEGTGFAANGFVALVQCVGTDITRCLQDAVGFAEVGADGAFATETAVTRMVDGVDCAEEAGRCRLLAIDADAEPGPDDMPPLLATVDLTFDPTSAVIVPELLVRPTTGLRDEQTITVAGRLFLPEAPVWFVQCVAGEADGMDEQNCRFLSSTETDTRGGFSEEVPVRRLVGTNDCAVVACVVRVMAYPDDLVDTAITFDASLPAPPVPTISVTPDAGLADRQTVSVTLSGIGGETYFDAQQCDPTGERCRDLLWDVTTGATHTFPITAHRMLGDQDCAVLACEVVVDLQEEGFVLRAPIAFDPSAPPAPGPTVRVEPATGLIDRQSVTVTGEGFDPRSGVAMRQCTGTEVTEATCSDAGDLSASDDAGNVSTTFTVRRFLVLPDGRADCVAVTCHLVVGDEMGEGGTSPSASATLAFDPQGPMLGSDLSAQPECIPWPTDGWSVGPLPAGVDAAAVEQLGEEMVGPDGGTSVVVIHGGRLVYENYADGITADSVQSSWSMSKSFTSTVVGLLVDDGKLALDERAPIPQWAGADDPRNAITLRHLLNMSSGLRWTEEYGNPESDVVRMITQPDAAGFAIDRPLESAPGTSSRYSTGDTMVLGRVIGLTAGVSGPSYEAYLHDELFDPLGIDPVEPAFDASGNWAAGWRTDTTTRNFAKLGLLYLRDGVWEDEQFLSRDWVEFVRTPSPANSGYGGQFWLDGDGSFRMVGILGQEVLIVPELDLVVAVNHGGDTYGMRELFEGAEAPSCDGVVPPAPAPAPAPEPVDTTPVTLDVTPTTAPAPSATSTPQRRRSGTIPRTGSEAGGALELGAALILLGGALTLGSRRRRRTDA